MNEEQMRKEFEEWFISTGHQKTALNRHKFYVEGMVEEMWMSWQASRQAMKPIKLPELPSVHDGYTKHEICFMAYAIDECKEAIEQAGYKVEV